MSTFADYDRARFNQTLHDSVTSGDMRKIAIEISPYIKVRTYENSFQEAILRTRQVQPSELIPEPGSNDTFYVLGQVEQPTKTAVAVNFRGQATEWYPAGRRFKIPIGKHLTKVSRKNEDELLAWDYDLFQALNDKDIWELHWLRDLKFLYACMASVVQSGKWKEFPLTGSLTVVRPDKIHFNESQNLLESGTRTGVPSKDTLKATKHLMSSTFYNDLALLESEGAGGDLVSDITINGYPATKILGTNYISSIKNFMFVQVDPVALITYTGISVAEDIIVVDGTTFTAKDSPSGNFEYDIKGDLATQATEVAAVLDLELGNEYEITTD